MYTQFNLMTTFLHMPYQEWNAQLSGPNFGMIVKQSQWDKCFDEGDIVSFNAIFDFYQITMIKAISDCCCPELN